MVARIIVTMTVFVLLASVVTTCAGQEVITNQTKEITNSMGMKFVLIPAGRFTMGSPPAERGSQEDEVIHKVELTQAFHLGVFEVTEHQWALIMEDEFKINVVEVRDPETNRLIKKEERKLKNPKLDSHLPVTGISWMDAVEFCKKLGQLPEEKKEGRVYRLPTEAEWEYASRAGASTAYSFGDDAAMLGEYAWFSANSGGKMPRPVGQKRPNSWGLYDMHGNAAEWCHDYYGAYTEGLVSNPIGPDVLLSLNRVFRGGAFESKESQCRSGWRGQCPDQGNVSVGFRVLMGARPLAAGVDSIVNNVGQRLVKILPGPFMMGSPDADVDEKPQHAVTISRSFYIGDTEVTQGQWKAVMGTEPWKGQANVREGTNYPATYVSWEDAVEYCRRLSEREGLTYRLPTEAEWEYACRSGTLSKFSFGDDESDLLRYGWFVGNTSNIKEGYAHEVKQKLANSFNLYDMHGNVFELCEEKVIRGGSWFHIASNCRAATRYIFSPSGRQSYVGFRLLLSPSVK